MTYLIDYILHYSTGHTSHTVRVKNCQNEADARFRFEQYAKTAYPVKASIVRIESDISASFNDIFGSNIFK
jgi:hypothetical protein